MNRFIRNMLAVILCLSLVTGILPMQQIGKDLALAAEILLPQSELLEGAAEFQNLLEEIDQRSVKTSGVWKYVLFQEKGYAVITAHLDSGITKVEVPDQIGGADVVGIADDSFAGHDRLNVVTVPGNVVIMGKTAIPQGTAVSAVNGSYAQRWAQKNGRGFQNASAFEFRNDVVDLTGTRSENFLRVSENEIKLRSLEARRISIGKKFFLLDPANPYQISYYQVESISDPVNGFVTICCSTPNVEDVLIHVSAENETMVPDYSTLRLEDGATLDSTHRLSGKRSVSIPIKYNYHHDIGNGWMINFDGKVEEKFEASYDIHLFGSRKFTLKEINSISLEGGFKYKEKTDSNSEENKKTTEELKQLLERKILSREQAKTLQVYKKIGSIHVFSLGGIVNVMMNISLSLEITARAEFKYSNISTISYTYKNGDLIKESTSDKEEKSVFLDGKAKFGVTIGIGIYILSYNVVSPEAFIGIEAKATISSKTTSTTHDQDNSLLNRINMNMLDCIQMSVSFVIEITVKFGSRDQWEIKAPLLEVPLLEVHYHLSPFVYTYNTGTQLWEAEESAKDQFHFADSCPYDVKKLEFIIQKENGRQIVLDYVDNVMLGQRVDLPNGIEDKAYIQKKKILGWYTDPEFSPKEEVAFPVTVVRESDEKTPTQTLYKKTVLYAKTTNYRETRLINSTGNELNTFTATIDHLDHLELWQNGSALIAGDESIILPSSYTIQEKERPIKNWIAVKSARERNQIGRGFNPGERYTVDGSSDQDLYLMALTDEDVVGHFVKNLNNQSDTIDVYCAKGGILTAPELQDTLSSTLNGWFAFGEGGTKELGYLLPGASFQTTAEQENEYIFYPDWGPKTNAISAPVDFPGLGSIPLDYNIPSDAIDEDKLIFSDGIVTGVRSGVTATHISIPTKRSNGTTVTAIAAGAFANNNSLISVFIPNTVTNIGNGAFQKCAKLKYVFMDSASITAVPDYFAEGCSSLLGVSIPTGITSIGNHAFEGCAVLESARLNWIICSSAFRNCIKLSNVTIGGNCRQILANAFENCIGLTELTVPFCVKILGNQFIQGCTNLKKLTIAAPVSLTKEMLLIGTGSQLEEVNLEEGVIGLQEKALSNGTNQFSKLIKVSLSSTIKTIGSRVFANSGIQELSLYLPMSTTSSIMTIADYAFSSMPCLESVTINGGRIPFGAFAGNTNLKTVCIKGGIIGNYAFANCTSLEEVIMEEGVKSIGTQAFYNCTGLTSLTIPDSVTQIKPGMFQGCTNLTYLKVGGGVPSLSTVEGNSTSNGVTNPFYIGAGSKLETLVLGEGIETIDNYIFANGKDTLNNTNKSYFTNLTKVIFPTTLTRLGSKVFNGANLREIELSSGLAASSSAFADMTTLKRVVIKGGAIGYGAFSGCSNLEEVIMEEGVTSIGAKAFYNCTSLTSVTIPDSVTQIRPGMFLECKNITYLKVGGGVKNICDSSESNRLEYYPPNSSASIYVYNPFYIGAGSKLETLVLGEGIETIDNYIFANGKDTLNYTNKAYFSNLTHVGLPSTLTSIGNGNLSAWKKVTSLLLPNGITSISDSYITASSGMTLYSNSYNQVIQRFATSRGLAYKYNDRLLYPTFMLTCVAPPFGFNTRGLTVSDGTITATRGIEGEETLLPEGFAILSTEEIVFTDPVDVPEIAVAEGYAFYGWYTDPELKTPWLMHTMPGANVTLYACIRPMIHVRFAVNVTSAGTMDNNLPEGFVLYRDYTIRENAAVPIPEDPSPDGYTFQGWFMDPGFTRDYMPQKIGRESITIYGKLQKISSGAVFELKDGNYMLTKYNLMDGESDTVHIPARVKGVPVTAIGPFAFRNGEVRAVYLPDTVTQIDPKAFAESSVYTISVSKNNNTYSALNGVVYSRDRSILICYPTGKTNRVFTVPESVRHIAAEAFAGNSFLQEITFRAGLESIGEGAFRDCVGLTDIILPDSVTTLGSEAFAGCSNMENFTAYGLNDIGADALPIETGLKGWGPVGDNPLRELFIYHTDNGSDMAWGYNQYMVNLYLDGVLSESVGNEAGMLLMSELRQVEFDDMTQVTEWYQDSKFSEIWNMDEDRMPAGNLNLYASKTPIYDFELVELTSGEETVTGIILTAYHGTARDLVIPEIIYGLPVIAIGEGFLNEYLGQLQSVTFPGSVIAIGNSALINTEGQTFNGEIICDADSYALEWAEENEIETSVLQYALTLINENVETNYMLGKNVAQRLPVPSRAGASFLGWFVDESLTLPAELENGCFIMTGSNTTLYAGWEISEEIQNLPFTWIEADGSITITGYTGTTDEIVIPTSVAGLPVVKVGKEAFRGLTLKSVDLGAITTIEEGALADCILLEEITLPASISSLGEDALKGCTALKNVYVQEGNNNLESENGVLFSKDKSELVLYPMGRRSAGYTVPENVTTIREGAFCNAVFLEEIHLPISLKSIGDEAFQGCEKLTTIEAEGLETIGKSAFFGCSMLQAVEIGDDLRCIGNYAFGGCIRLTEIRIPEAVELDPQSLIFSDEEQITIIGRAGSSAQMYANARGIIFNDPNAKSVTRMTVIGLSHEIERGETMQLTVFSEPEDAEIGTSHTWISSDESIAFMDSNDTVHALRSGAVTLTVISSNGIRTTYDLEVQVAVTSVTMNPVIRMLPGEEIMPTIDIAPADATNKNLTWSSSNETVAYYDPESGQIIAAGEGNAVITATSHNNLSTSTIVYVYYPINNVQMNVPSRKMFVINGYNTQQATVEILPENASDRFVSWVSDQPETISVNEEGVITALKPGTATITVTGGSLYGETWKRSCLVMAEDITHVLKLPEGLKAIEEDAFRGDTGIEAIILGDNVESIGSGAFAEMYNLQVIVIPNSVENISEGTFEGSWPMIIAPKDSAAYKYAQTYGYEWMP